MAMIKSYQFDNQGVMSIFVLHIPAVLF